MNNKYCNDIIYGVNNHINNIKSNFQVDDLDIKLINLMMKGNNNKQIGYLSSKRSQMMVMKI